MSFHAELLLRIVVATVLGAAIGLERELQQRPAGLRTHMLVALAAATFMVVSTHFVYFQQYRREDPASGSWRRSGSRPAAACTRRASAPP